MFLTSFGRNDNIPRIFRDNRLNLYKTQNVRKRLKFTTDAWARSHKQCVPDEIHVRDSLNVCAVRAVFTIAVFLTCARLRCTGSFDREIRRESSEYQSSRLLAARARVDPTVLNNNNIAVIIIVIN